MSEYSVDIGYDNIYPCFENDANRGFEKLTALQILATAYCATEHETLLEMEPEAFLSKWEALAEARSLRPPETGAAADNATATATAAAGSDAARAAVKVIKVTRGTMSLIGAVRNLPEVNAEGRISLAAFPRLQKIAPRSTVKTSRLRELAARVGVVLPADGDGGEEAQAKWGWGLAKLTRSITAKAIGFLGIAHAASNERWDDAVSALGADGRFTPEWMGTERARYRSERGGGAGAAGASAGGYDASVLPLAYWEHAADDITDHDIKEKLAKALALVTGPLHGMPMDGAGYDMRAVAVGTALQITAQKRNQAVASVPKMPDTNQGEALQCLTGYLFQRSEAAAASTPGGVHPQPPPGAPPMVMTLDQETLKALRPAQPTEDSNPSGSNKIVLGKAPATKGSLKRPEYFAVNDVAAFQQHEAALLELHALDKKTPNKDFLKRFRELPESARSLVEVPVFPGDLARNHCLNVLSALADRVSAAGDDLIRKGTILGKYRESEDQRQQDRERAGKIAELRRGDVVSAGPNICVVDFRLESAYDFLQVPYLGGKTASAINGDWDSTWFLWADVAESQLGPDCEIKVAVEKIVRMIRQTSRQGDVPWTDQQRADYGAVALYQFARDYRRWREGLPDAVRPSLLRILGSADFAEYKLHAFDYANKLDMRPDTEPYNRVRLGQPVLKRKRETLTAAALAAEADDDEFVDAALATGPQTPGKKKKPKKKPKKNGDKGDTAPPTTTGGPKGGGAKRTGKGAGAGDDGGGGGGSGSGDKASTGKPSAFLEWKNVEGGGSAWPSMEHRLNNDNCALLQAKLDVSNGLDKGVCAYFFFGTCGCAKDKRAGVIGKCGKAHSGPADRKDEFMKALCKTASMKMPMRLKNQRLWTDTPSGHPSKRAPSPAPSAGKDGDDDDDDDDDAEAHE